MHFRHAHGWLPVVFACALVACEEGPPPSTATADLPDPGASDDGTGGAVDPGGTDPGTDAPPDIVPGAPTDESALVCRQPGATILRRLNRTEYDNTVRDLLWDDSRPASLTFPGDDVSFGFDNIGSALTISPLHLDKYLATAERLVDRALRPRLADPEVFHFEAEEIGSEVGARFRDSAWNLWSNGAIDTTVELPDEGLYRFSTQVLPQQGGEDLVRMSLSIDGRVRGTFDLEGQGPRIVDVREELTAGDHTIQVTFLNDFYDPDNNADRNLIVDWLRIEGPLDLPPPDVDGPRERILTCTPDETGAEACTREVVGNFATRAWRRPVTDTELDRLVALAAAAEVTGDDDVFEAGIRLALQAILVSPHFIFRVESDFGEGPHHLDSFELATRLSYFIWSAPPDATLSAAAAGGELVTPAQIEAQVRRMLADPRSEALIDNFAEQWLYLRQLDTHEPDYPTFPDYDAALADAFRAETRLYFRAFLEEDRSALDLLDADFTFANARLAEHYGLPADDLGEEMERIDTTGTTRGGLLTQGSILTVTSYPRRTSVVRRGEWVMEQLLCQGPPPPPAGVEADVGAIDPDLPLRERMARHREDPTCATCHVLMDEIGFGLENFDGIGAWRDEEKPGLPVDARGTLPSGDEFEGAKALAGLLKADPAWSSCLVDQMFTYALGRGPGVRDQCHIESIGDAWAERGHRLSDLVVLIATSEAFRMRTGEGVTAAEVPDPEPETEGER